MLNADNNITTGWRAKRDFKAMTANLIMDYKNNHSWPIEDVQHYRGLLSYYKMVEKDYYTDLLAHYNTKFKVNVEDILKHLCSMNA